MIQMIQQFDVTVRTAEPAAQPQTGAAQRTGSFRDALRAAGKAPAKSDGASGKAEEPSGKGEKAEKDARQADGITASAAAQNTAPAIVPAPGAQAQKGNPAIPAPNGDAQTAAEAVTVQPVPAPPLEMQQIPAQAVQLPAQTQTANTAQQVPAQAQAEAGSAVRQNSAQSSDPPRAQTENAARAARQANSPTDAEQPGERQSAVTAQSAAVGDIQTADAEPAGAFRPNAARAARQPQSGPGETASAEADTDTPPKETARTGTAAQAAQGFPGFSPEGKVVVKVSDVPAQAKTPVSRQIAGAVADGMKEGKQQIQIDLYPQSLGKVSVKMSAESGVLTIEIAASNPKTQSLLASSSGEIRSLLQASAGKPVQVTEQQQNAGQYAQQQNGGSAQQEAARQQQQEQEAQRQQARWYAAGNPSGFSAGDFLAALKRAAV